MLILNFSHPITPVQHAQLAAMLGTQPEIRTIAVQLDHRAPLLPQIVAVVEAAALTPEHWQTTPLLINPPGYAPAAAALLAELHGRIGHFPALIQLRPLEGSTPTVYEVAEVINLQQVREHARTQRRG